MNIEALAANLQDAWSAAMTALMLLILVGYALREIARCPSHYVFAALIKPLVIVPVSVLAYLCTGFALAHGSNDTGWIGTSGFWLHTLPAPLAENGHANPARDILTAALATTVVCCALAERLRLRAVIVLAALTGGFVVPVFQAWALSPDGWLAGLGFSDRAGANAVHALAGWLALAGIFVLGARPGRFPERVIGNESPGATGAASNMTPGNDPSGRNAVLTLLGSSLIWLGFLGLVGSALPLTEGTASIAFSNLLMGVTGGVIGGVTATRLAGADLTRARRSVIAYSNGAIAGLVSMCAAPTEIVALEALAVAFAAGVLAAITVIGLFNQRIDDAGDIIANHGMAGAVGTAASAFVAGSSGMNSAIVSAQLVGVVACFVWAMLAGLLVFRLVALVQGEPAPGAAESERAQTHSSASRTSSAL